MADSLPLPVELRKRIVAIAGYPARLACTDFLACADSDRHTLTWRVPDDYPSTTAIGIADACDESTRRIHRMLQRCPNLHHISFLPSPPNVAYLDSAHLRLTPYLRSLCLGANVVIYARMYQQPFTHLTHLTHLTRLEAFSMTTVLPLASLPDLRSLKLSSWDGTGMLALVTHCTLLARIDLTGCSSLKNVDALAALGDALLHLDLTCCKLVTNIDPLAAACANLEDICVSCSGVTGLHAFYPSPALRALGMHTGFTDADVLMLPPGLRRLDVTGCCTLTRPPVQLGSAWTLRGCIGSIGVETLFGRRRGFSLFAGFDKDSLVDLSAVTDSPDLDHVTLYKHVNLSDISGLASCAGLRSLRILDCHALTVIPCSLAFIVCLRPLVSLDLSCTRVADISPISSCSLLRKCSLNYTAVASLSPLSSCVMLRILSLQGCPLVTDLGPISSCTQLIRLDISGCTGITGVFVHRMARRVDYELEEED